MWDNFLISNLSILSTSSDKTSAMCLYFKVLLYFFTNFIKQNKLTNEEQQNLIQFLNNFKNNPKNLKNNLENKNVSDNIKALSYLLLEIYDNAKVSQVI